MYIHFLYFENKMPHRNSHFMVKLVFQPGPFPLTFKTRADAIKLS